MASDTKHNGDYCILEGQKHLSPAEHATLSGGAELEKVLSRVANGSAELPDVAHGKGPAQGADEQVRQAAQQIGIVRVRGASARN